MRLWTMNWPERKKMKMKKNKINAKSHHICKLRRCERASIDIDAPNAYTHIYIDLFLLGSSSKDNYLITYRGDWAMSTRMNILHTNGIDKKRNWHYTYRRSAADEIIKCKQEKNKFDLTVYPVSRPVFALRSSFSNRRKNVKNFFHLRNRFIR